MFKNNINTLYENEFLIRGYIELLDIIKSDQSLVWIQLETLKEVLNSLKLILVEL